MWPYEYKPEKLREALKVIDNSLYAKKEVKIIIPGHYTTGQLASIDETTNIVGIWCGVVDNKYYGVCVCDALMQITPTSTTMIKIDGEEYLEFTFEAGECVLPSLDLIKAGTFTYRIHEELIGKGKVPPYIRYKEHFMHLFDSSAYHGGINYGVDRAIVELAISTIARNPTKLLEFYSNIYSSTKKIPEPTYISLNSVSYNSTNTTAKLLGNRTHEAITSSLIQESERLEPIEELLRK